MLNKYFLSTLIIVAFTEFVLSQDTTSVTNQTKYSASTVAEFWHQMDDIFNDPNFANANWGVMIQSLETGEYFYKRNEDKLFVPASNLKLITSAAGLIFLGEDYQYKTNILIRGKIDGPELIGDLVLQGTGDPTISGRFYKNDMLSFYKMIADSLLNMGIDEIRGNLIGDDDAFDDNGLGEGWSWDYESYWYSAPSGAISFNDNCIDIVVKRNVKENSAEILLFPDTKYVIVQNEVEIVPKDSATNINIYRQRGTNYITIFGKLSENTDSVKLYCTINNPTQYSMVVFKEVLQEKGIYVKGYPIDIDDLSYPLEYDSLKLLFSFKSPPLKEIIKVINKNSQNFFAEQLLKTIGYEKEGEGTALNGIKTIKNVLLDMGINPEGVSIVDGSGLSNLNLISPRHIVTLLSYLYKSRFYVPFLNSLPIAGIDGTLGKRMKNTRAESKVRAKTGFISHVRSLSGYTSTADNEPIAFSMIVNNFSVPVKLAENIQDLVCLRLVNFKRK
jgi:D-alanyl-D-alanine carboxypeptidase/D-alanyl-D-alanine-endopeptidase (penicillin-binding protein 4)